MAFSNSLFSIGIIILIIVSPAGALSQSSHSDTLKITSWNLHLLPAPIFFRSKKKKRIDSIVNHFLNQQENDILLFQEVFHKQRRKQLISGLTKVYPYHTTIVNPTKWQLFKTNSGLIIFSKFPLEEVESIKFNNCSGSDCMAYKGAQMVRANFNQQTVYIINTHLNSEPLRSIAIGQMRMIKDSLAKQAYEKSPYVFIGGDFNINISDSINYQKMVKVFKTKNKYHFDKSKNSSTRKYVKNTLDYIFLYNSKESKIKMKKVKYLIGPEWKKDNSKKIYGKTVGLSDHYPIQSTITIQK